jgi:putative addiction module component (TIGR02574 family)
MDLALPLSQMTVAEKLQAIEVLWDDLARNPEDIPSPSWHGDVLAARQRQIDEGQAKFLSWDEFRQSIQEKTR